MKIEQKFDKIIDILYDESLLHWKEIPATDIIAFGKSKFNIDWSDAEINFIISTLQNDGYIVLNKTDVDSMKTPTFSLTAKGVQMKRKGGFQKTKLVEDVKNIIILWGSIIALIVSIITVYDFINKTWLTNESNICCNCNSKSDNETKEKNNHSTNEINTEININESDSIKTKLTDTVSKKGDLKLEKLQKKTDN
ncbi:MAG: hypothetical protein LDL23_10940 [Flavobacterium sp.]|uniref:hypothetical protein n=1 Tax=Flavobacterium sp. TaxID=239 RepID=UPI0025BBD79B|nr:hypothetical protein [Flavobacterium sp.]MCA1967149.1 hypothetical protein [Flavobacterium sp.]